MTYQTTCYGGVCNRRVLPPPPLMLQTGSNRRSETILNVTQQRCLTDPVNIHTINVLCTHKLRHSSAGLWTVVTSN